MLINRENRGQTSHLYPKDMEKIKIPVPEDTTTQNENAKKYISNYKKYEELVSKADKILEDTYKDFEETFLK